MWLSTPKTATDPDLWNFGIGHSPLVPLSPLRPIFTEILLTSLAVDEEGAELVGMTVQMDLPELGLTGEAILTDIRSAPAVDPPCRGGFSPSGEPWSCHRFSNGKACLRSRPIDADIAALIAHKVATRREILSGREDLPVSPASGWALRKPSVCS